MASEARRGQILEAAAAAVLSQGYLPLALDKLARDAGVSKALIYNHFPTQHDLLNAVLAREFQALTDNGAEAAADQPELMDAALALASLYFDHVSRRGAVIHIVLRDQYMARKLDPALARQRDAIVRRLARTARRCLHIPAKENIAAINMVITIPEEAGRLAYGGEIATDRGRELCAELVRSSIGALSHVAQPS